MMARRSDYASKLVKGLDRLRREDQLCDVMINVGDRAFQAHKAVLAASTDYFKDMFTTGCKESFQSEVHIDGKAEIFELLLEFVYTGNLQITTNTVNAIDKMADYMLLSDVKHLCSRFMKMKCQAWNSNVPDYTKKLVKAMHEFQTQDQLCDVSINVGVKTFRAHKAVLAACSVYFTTTFEDENLDALEVDGNVDVFQMILKFVYTGGVKLTPSVAYDALKMVCDLKFSEFSVITNTCFKFVKDKLASPTAADKISVDDIYKMQADDFGKYLYGYDHAVPVVEVSSAYLLRNMSQLKMASAFLQCPQGASFLKWYLQQSNIKSADGEKGVLEMVVKWLKYDWENRCTQAFELLQKVRLGTITEENLNRLIDADLLELPECKSLLESVIGYQKSDRTKAWLAHKYPDLFATRSTITVPFTWDRVGDNDDRSCTFNYYDQKVQQWAMLSKFPTLQHSPAMIVVEGELYAAGGLAELTGYDDSLSESEQDSDSDENYFVKTKTDFYRYDADQNIWRRLPSMKKARFNLHLVHNDKYIFAIGGLTRDDDLLNYVERYDLETKKWDSMASLPEGFQWTSAIPFEGKIMVYGVSKATKSDPADRKSSYICRHVIQVYDTNTWHCALSEQRDASGTHGNSFSIITPPVLFVHNGSCYRSLHLEPTVVRDYYGDPFHPQNPSVDLLKLETQDGAHTVTVSEAINQDLILSNTVGAFRIQEQLFLNVRGFIHNTNDKIPAGQQTSVKLRKWEKFTGVSNVYSICPRMVVQFTFDEKKLGACYLSVPVLDV